MSFVNQEIKLTDFLKRVRDRVILSGDSEALILLDTYLQVPQLLEALTMPPDWDDTFNAGDFDAIYPCAVSILLDAASRLSSDAHSEIYGSAHVVSVAFCDELNKTFDCSGDELFELLPINSFTELMLGSG